MNSDIALDTLSHDLTFEGDDLILFDREEDSIRQRLRIGLSTIAGEWFLNTEVGLPISSPIFSQKGSQAVLDSYVRRFIEDFEGVEELTSYSSQLDRATRTTYITFTARTISGDILSFNEAL